MQNTMHCKLCSCGKIYQLQLLNLIHQLHLFNVKNSCTVFLKIMFNRNLTVSPCGRSAGTVPEPPELYTKDKIIFEGCRKKRVI